MSSLPIVLCLSRDWCALFSFLQTLFLWLCMPRHRGRIGYPLSKKIGIMKKPDIILFVEDAWQTWIP